MKKTFKTAASLALLAALFISLLTLTSCFYANEPYEWEINSDEDKIWNEDKSYEVYDIPVGYKVAFTPRYYFDDDMSTSMLSDYYTVISYARDGDVISVRKNYDPTQYFVTPAGRNSINALVSGNYAKIGLYRSNEMAFVNAKTISWLDALYNGGTDTVEIDVGELKSLVRYDVRAYDSTGSVYYVYGAIYEYDDKDWYVSYDKLSNDYFDANGDFSYRRGSVTMYSLEGTAIGVRIDNDKKHLTRIDTSTVKELDDINPDPEREPIDPEVSARTTFWVVYSLAAFGFPAWPFVMGIRNSGSKKHGFNKRWRVLSLGALIWVAIGILIMLLLIFG